MKAIIQCYSPEEVERIARGEQTVKVCKTAPKEVPFKVYMYCTKGGYMYRCRFDENRLAIPEVWNGKVIGEFICDKIEECIPDYNPIIQEFFYNEWADCSASCLTSKEEAEYGKGKTLYGLHISNLKIYDKPKELSEFYTLGNCEKYDFCNQCKNFHRGQGWMNGSYYDEDSCLDNTRIPVTRAPQSWQYVEEV